MANGAGFRQISARVEEWSRDPTRLVCAGAGARKQCVSSIHSSISSNLMEGIEGKQLNRLCFCKFCELEQTGSITAKMERSDQSKRVGRGEAESLQGGVFANHRPSHSQVFSWWADFSARWPVGQSVEAPQIAPNQFEISQTEYRPARRHVRSGASAGTRVHAQAGVCDRA